MRKKGCSEEGQACITAHRLLEARLGKSGKREFVQVLRLLEVFGLDDVLAGIREAIARSRTSR